MGLCFLYVPSLPLSGIHHFAPVRPRQLLPAMSASVSGPTPADVLAPSPASATFPGQPAHVGIAGGGIGGLTTALALLRTPGTGVQHVTIFDPRDSLDTELDGALILHIGAAVLAKHYGLARELRRIGRPVRAIRGRNADGSRSGGDVLLNVNIERAVLKNPAARKWLVHDGDVMVMTVMRDDLQRVLIDALPGGGAACVNSGKLVAHVLVDEDCRYRFEFADGSVSDDAFDMVVGADGLWSTVAEFVVGDGQYKPPRDIVRVQYAVSPPRPARLKPEDADYGVVREWYGKGARAWQYVLECTSEDGGRFERDLLALAFGSKGWYPTGGKAGYEQSDVRANCERRLHAAGISQDEVFEVFGRCDRFIEVGVHLPYQTELSAKATSGCTVVGDRTFKMLPPLSDGANGAIQDAHALAMAVAGIDSAHATLSEALKAYEHNRSWFPVTMSSGYLFALEFLLLEIPFLAKLGVESFVFMKLAFLIMEVE
jgi:2-polyprenyl-6-methoxyphenol hydroxylase-like FAD-dependent oxidoreductase